VFQEIEATIFQEYRHVNEVSFSHYPPATFTQREIILVLIYVRGRVGPIFIVRPEGISMETSNDTIVIRTHDLLDCSQMKQYSHYISFPPINSSPINHKFNIKQSELTAVSLCKTQISKSLCTLAIVHSNHITNMRVLSGGE